MLLVDRPLKMKRAENIQSEDRDQSNIGRDEGARRPVAFCLHTLSVAPNR